MFARLQSMRNSRRVSSQNHVAALIFSRNDKARRFEKSERPDFRPAFAVMRFTRLHQGAQKGDATNLGALSEPRR